jgi:hypothetical protein
MNAQGLGMGFWRRNRRILFWVVGILVVAFIALLMWRDPMLSEQKQSAQMIAQIQAQHLTLADADGSSLPPTPDPKAVDATVAGVDANNNGIRDDVELAIFKAYPTSPYTRAAELQYAMTEQMFLTDVFDTATWKAVAELNDRASVCLSQFDANKSLRLQKEVESLVFNTNDRKSAQEKTYNFITSYGTQPGKFCDVDASQISH